MEFTCPTTLTSAEHTESRVGLSEYYALVYGMDVLLLPVYN